MVISTLHPFRFSFQSNLSVSLNQGLVGWVLLTKVSPGLCLSTELEMSHGESPGTKPHVTSQQRTREALN